jgi:hypothetical protein
MKEEEVAIAVEEGIKDVKADEKTKPISYFVGDSFLLYRPYFVIRHNSS